MDKEECWNSICDIFKEQNHIDEEDIGNSFVVVGKMIETCPTILVRFLAYNGAGKSITYEGVNFI